MFNQFLHLIFPTYTCLCTALRVYIVCNAIESHERVKSVSCISVFVHWFPLWSTMNHKCTGLIISHRWNLFCFFLRLLLLLFYDGFQNCPFNETHLLELLIGLIIIALHSSQLQNSLSRTNLNTVAGLNFTVHVRMINNELIRFVLLGVEFNVVTNDLNVFKRIKNRLVVVPPHWLRLCVCLYVSFTLYFTILIKNTRNTHTHTHKLSRHEKIGTLFLF